MPLAPFSAAPSKLKDYCALTASIALCFIVGLVWALIYKFYSNRISSWEVWTCAVVIALYTAVFIGLLTVRNVPSWRRRTLRLTRILTVVVFASGAIGQHIIAGTMELGLCLLVSSIWGAISFFWTILVVRHPEVQLFLAWSDGKVLRGK